MTQPSRQPGGGIRWIVGAVAATLALTAVCVSLVAAAGAGGRPTRGPIDCLARINGVDLENATIPQLNAALRTGKVTSVELVRAYLRRRAFDRGVVAIDAVRAVVSDALAQARRSDRRRRAHRTLGPLDGIPILLKDNIDTVDAPTTAGSIALQGNVPRSDAMLVRQLRAAGAVILEKMNLSEFAFWMDPRMPEGYSSLGGQVLNPYNGGSPSGSSSGPGAGEALAYGAAAIGTETAGSILAPADVASLVAVKPTVGLISRNGVIPLAPTWDTPGPMTRNVTDAAIVLEVLAGHDPRDRVFDEAPGRPRAKPNYLAALGKQALRGARLGYSPSDLAAMASDERAVMTRALHDLAAAGAKLVPTDQLAKTRSVGGTELSAFPNEFKYGINQYLARQASRQLPVHDLGGIIAYNRRHPNRIKYGQGLLLESEATPGLYNQPSEIANRRRTIRASRGAIDAPLRAHHLDAYLAPSALYALVGAAAQYPTVMVPMGFINAGSTPIGLGFLGHAWTERRLLALAYAYEQNSHRRRPPTAVNPQLLHGICR